jgi:hypothetical protein
LSLTIACGTSQEILHMDHPKRRKQNRTDKFSYVLRMSYNTLSSSTQQLA